MTALLRARGSAREMASLWGAACATRLDWPAAIWPGDRIPVVRQVGDERALATATWGLPQHRFRRSTPEAQRGTMFNRDFTDSSRLDRHHDLERCLIVIESFACPVTGATGAERLWFGLWDHPLAAWAGFCTPDGAACAGMMVAANDRVAPHTAMMPRLLRPDDYAAWLGGAWLLSLGAPFSQQDFYRERLGERWSTGHSHETLPLAAAA